MTSVPPPEIDPVSATGHIRHPSPDEWVMDLTDDEGHVFNASTNSPGALYAALDAIRQRAPARKPSVPPVPGTPVMKITEKTAGPPEPLIGDAERDAVVAAIHEHFCAGRLTRGEFDERVGVAIAARHQSELDQLLGDLPPVPRRAVPASPSPADPVRIARTEMLIGSRRSRDALVISMACFAVALMIMIILSTMTR